MGQDTGKVRNQSICGQLDFELTDQLKSLGFVVPNYVPQTITVEECLLIAGGMGEEFFNVIPDAFFMLIYQLMGKELHELAVHRHEELQDPSYEQTCFNYVYSAIKGWCDEVVDVLYDEAEERGLVYTDPKMKGEDYPTNIMPLKRKIH